MASRRLNIPLPNRGGNINVPGEFIDPREVTGSKNVSIEDGVPRKRRGTRALGSAMSERVMAFAQLVLGANVYVLRFGLTKVELLTQGTETWSDVTGTALTGSADDVYSFAYPHISGARVLAFTNGIDPIRYWNGSGNTQTLGGTPPLAKYMIAFGPHLILGNTTESGTNYPFRMRISDVANPQLWSGGSARTFDLIDDGRDITGFGRQDQFLTIHKETAIYLGYLVSDSTVMVIERRDTGVGAAAHNTIANLPTGEQIFLARDGIRLFNGTTAPLIPSSLQKELRNSLNPQAIRRAVGLVVPTEDEYWCAVPTGDSENIATVYKWNWKENHFWTDERVNLSALGLYTSTTQLTIDELEGTMDSLDFRYDDVFFNALAATPVFGFQNGATTETTTSKSDVGQAIQFYIETKDFTAQDFDDADFGRRMRWRKLQLWAKGGSLTVYYSIDGGDSWTFIETVELPNSYPSDTAPVYVRGFDVVSSQIRFRFVNNSADETPYIKKYWPEAIPREMRR